jgi:hypothetical protein
MTEAPPKPLSADQVRQMFAAKDAAASAAGAKPMRGVENITVNELLKLVQPPKMRV